MLRKPSDKVVLSKKPAPERSRLSAFAATPAIGEIPADGLRRLTGAATRRMRAFDTPVGPVFNRPPGTQNRAFDTPVGSDCVLSVPCDSTRARPRAAGHNNPTGRKPVLPAGGKGRVAGSIDEPSGITRQG